MAEPLPQDPNMMQPADQKPRTTGEKLAALGNALLDIAAEMDALAADRDDVNTRYNTEVEGRKKDSESHVSAMEEAQRLHDEEMRIIKDSIAKALED